MKIRVSYTGYLNLVGIPNGSELEVKEGTTLGDLLDLGQIQKAHQRALHPFVNDEEKRLHYVVQDGDDVTFVLQVGGGASP